MKLLKNLRRMRGVCPFLLINLALGLSMWASESLGVQPTYRGFAYNGWSMEFRPCVSNNWKDAAECGCLAWNPGTAFLCPGRWSPTWLSFPHDSFKPDANGLVHCTVPGYDNACRSYGIMGNAWAECPVGYQLVEGDCMPLTGVIPAPPRENLGKPPYCTKGNPINHGTGNKLQFESDYSAGVGLLQFSRTYNSAWGQRASFLGKKWRSSFDWTLTQIDQTYWVIAPDGKSFEFNFNPTTKLFTPVRPNVRHILRSTYVSNVLVSTTFTSAAEEVLVTFNAKNRVSNIESVTGEKLTILYSDDHPEFGNEVLGLPVAIVDNFGRSILFKYDEQHRINELITPDARSYLYTYDAVGNLESVRYPGATLARRYFYEDLSHPYALTGIQDENGIRYATFAYDAVGRATFSGHAGGVSSVTVDYSNPTAVIVTDALNTSRTFQFEVIHGIVRSKGSSQPPGAGCADASEAIVYDINGNVQARTDFNGNVTSYIYDISRNLELTRTEAANRPVTERRVTSMQWHPYWRLPTKVAEPKKLTTYVYNGDAGTTPCAPTDALIGTQPIGVLCSKTEQATTDATGAQGLSPTLAGSPRKWKYTYNKWGQVLTANGPRTDGTSDTTTYTYDPVKGNLLTVTNALQQTTMLGDYDANGRVRKVTDPNGLITMLSYHPRGWLETRTVGNQTTRYTYDGVGQLTEVWLPDNFTSDKPSVKYTYDTAHRLTDIEDAAGNKIHYVLDKMGNRTGEEIKDLQGDTAKALEREYDALNRMNKLTGVR